MAVAPDAHAVDTVKHGPGEAESERQQRRQGARHHHRNGQRTDALQAVLHEAASCCSSWIDRGAQAHAADDGAPIAAAAGRDRTPSIASCAAPIASWCARSKRRRSTGRQIPARVEARDAAHEHVGVGGSRSSMWTSAVERAAHSDAHSSSTVRPPGVLTPAPTTATARGRPHFASRSPHFVVQLPAISRMELKRRGIEQRADARGKQPRLRADVAERSGLAPGR